MRNGMNPGIDPLGNQGWFWNGSFHISFPGDQQDYLKEAHRKVRPKKRNGQEKGLSGAILGELAQ